MVSSLKRHVGNGRSSMFHEQHSYFCRLRDTICRDRKRVRVQRHRIAAILLYTKRFNDRKITLIISMEYTAAPVSIRIPAGSTGNAIHNLLRLLEEEVNPLEFYIYHFSLLKNVHVGCLDFDGTSKAGVILHKKASRRYRIKFVYLRFRFRESRV